MGSKRACREMGADAPCALIGQSAPALLEDDGKGIVLFETRTFARVD